MANPNITNISPVDHDDRESFPELLFAKVLTMIVLGISSFVLGVIPIKLVSKLNSKVPSRPVHSEHSHNCHSHDDQSLLVSVLLCFGGGVLLFTTFLHVGPEVRENLEDLKERGGLPEFLANDDLHLADLMLCLGFFLVYFIDETAHAILDSTPPVLAEEAILHRTMSLRKCSRHSEFGHGTMIPRVTLNNNSPRDIDNSLLSAGTGGHGYLADSVNNSLRSAAALVQERKALSDSGTDDSTTSGNGPKKSFRGLFAILALSFHEIFEGLAVGLETSVQNVWYLFAAIATHKLVISFCMGIDLVSTQTKISAIVMYIFCFAVVTPVGILIGIVLLLSEDGSSAESTILTFILQGISSGTLLYVIFFEVLRREKSNAKSGFLQLLAVVTGFSLMLLLQIAGTHQHVHKSHVPLHDDLDNHDHNHHHHHHHSH